jgi:hypothetical protein
VFQSTNNAVSFTRRIVGLTASNIGDLAFDPTNTQILFATSPGDANNLATAGVYSTGDAAMTWVKLDVGLGRISAVPVAVNTSSQVFAGTQGGGVWRRP